MKTQAITMIGDAAIESLAGRSAVPSETCRSYQGDPGLGSGFEPSLFWEHARNRMSLRGVTDREAIKVLRIGEIKGEISPERKAGEWKCKVVAKLKGSREIGVITVTMAPGTLFVKTVEWEDP